MICMAKKRMGRPPKNPDLKPGQRSTVLLGARVSPEFLERFEAFISRFNSKNARTDKSAHVEQAIKEYLDREEPLLGD